MELIEQALTPGTDQFGGLLLIVVPSILWAISEWRSR